MKAVLILDTETSGLGPSDRVVEIGAVLWSVSHATTIASYSTLVDGPSNGAHHINGIPPASLVEGADEAAVWERLSGWLARADAICAHNADFDRRFAPKGWDCGKPWIDTMDVEWPQHCTSKALVNIVLQHGLGVSHAHRALTDCELIARLLERVAELGHDVEDMLRLAARPKVLVRAIVSYEDREKASACGFRWDKESKMWTRKVCMEDANAFPFAVEQL
jgi:DNA polymerase-3 subunit epsilon